MSSCLSPGSNLTTVMLGQVQQMCAMVERRLLTDTQDLSINDPPATVSSGTGQGALHRTCVGEAQGGDSNKDFLWWEKVE